MWRRTRMMGTNDPFTRLNIIAMQIQGLWPVSLFGKKISAIHRTFGVFITLCYALFTATMFADVVISRDNLEAVIRNLSISLLYFSGILKATAFLFTRNTIDDLVKHAGKFSRRIKRSGNAKSMKIFNKYVKYSTLLTLGFWGSAGTTIIGFCGAPIIGVMMGAKEEPSQLIFRAWNPFSDLWSGYLFQLMMTSLTGIMTASWSTLTGVLVMIPTCELRILSDELEGLIDGEDRHYWKEEELEKRLANWVKRHIAVIQYVESLDRVLNHLLLIDFVIYAGIFCTIFFQYSVMEFTFESIVAVGYLLATVNQLLMIYWTGNELKLHSESLAEASYRSIWYKASKSYKTNIQIIMRRCQKPLKLRAWKLYDISMATYLKISSTAYSYFAILRHIYSKK